MSEDSVDCREVFSLLSEYIDGELPENLCASLDQHIGDCAPCVEFVESLRKAKVLCRQFKAAEQPAPMDKALRDQLREALSKCLSEEKG